MTWSTHLAQDLVSAMIAALAVLLRINLHVQTHGMIDDTTKRLAKPLDAFVIRPILRRAISVFYLTEREHSDLLAIEPAARLVELRTGVPAATAPPEDHKSPNGVEPLRILYVAGCSGASARKFWSKRRSCCWRRIQR